MLGEPFRVPRLGAPQADGTPETKVPAHGGAPVEEPGGRLPGHWRGTLEAEKWFTWPAPEHS